MSRVSRGLRITGKTIKFIFFFFVFSVMAFLLWRVFSSGNPDSMKRITPNDKLYAAYETHGKDLYMFDQNLDRITRAETNYGYFAVTDCVFIPNANQIQIVVRYNNSTIRSLAKDYSLDTVPSRHDDLFDVSLTVATDLTPDDDSDNFGNASSSVAFTRIHPVSVERDTKNLYNFRRYVFDLDQADISLKELLEKELLLAVYTDVYYNADIDYDQKPYGTLCLFDHLMEKKTVDLTTSDVQALRKYAENGRGQ